MKKHRHGEGAIRSLKKCVRCEKWRGAKGFPDHKASVCNQCRRKEYKQHAPLDLSEDNKVYSEWYRSLGNPNRFSR